MIKTFDKPTEPELPFKRGLTEQEQEVMRKYFKHFSWPLHIDANGYVVLGGGKDSKGLHYITEDDLNLLN